MIRFLCTLAAMFLVGMASGQKAIAKEIAAMQASGQQPTEAAFLQYQSNDVKDRSFNMEGLAHGTVLALDQESIQSLFSQQDKVGFIKVSIPVTERSNMTLILKQHNIFTSDFALYTSDAPGIPVEYTHGIHYKGIIEGQPNSVVALSVFNDQVMALMSTDQGNAVIGPIENDRENRHVFYQDKDLDRLADFECGTLDDGIGYTEDQLTEQPHGRDLGDCVRLYIEIDDDIVTQKGGAGPATTYITGLFNQVIVLYNNESINMTINEILAWTTNSPYTGGTSSAMLSSYQANTGSFNGNLSHLVSYQASGGIAAGFNGICNSNPDLSKCFSSLDGVYSNVPVYSWDVMVSTHEMGHLIGSRHTHACVWNGNNTAIDGCAGSVEGNCPLPGYPAEGGTIMSYCHLQSVGINFNLGFGPQPGAVIRNTVNATGNCLTGGCGDPPPPPPPAYCASNGSNTSDEWINKVVLGSINNTSGNNNGYGNFTALSTNLSAGSTYTINLTPGFSGQTYTEYWRVWIDYNNDLDWSDAGEQVGQGFGTSAVNVTFTVPSGSPAVTTRMRVSMQYNAYPPVCGTFTWGEVEDYTVVIGGAPPATCDDGIQNQDETGVDCGGAICPPCGSGGETVLLASYFETGWDSWLDGGSDVARVNSSNSYEGLYSIRIADNSGTQSAMTSPTFNLSDATGLKIQFYFRTSSMESGEDFWVRYNNGSGYATIATLTSGTSFNNNAFYTATVTVPNFAPTNAGTLRIQCDASDNSDQVFIDQVTITKLTGSGLIQDMVLVEEAAIPHITPNPQFKSLSVEAGNELFVYPNPVKDVLNISYPAAIQEIRLVTMDGLTVEVPQAAVKNKAIDIQSLAPGIYFLWIQADGEWYPTRFSKM